MNNIDRILNNDLTKCHYPFFWLYGQETVENVIALLGDARETLLFGDPLDAVCTLCESAVSELSLLDGRGVTEDIVSRIFARFCVGK